MPYVVLGLLLFKNIKKIALKKFYVFEYFFLKVSHPPTTSLLHVQTIVPCVYLTLSRPLRKVFYKVIKKKKLSIMKSTRNLVFI